MASPNIPHNAYTHAPQQHPNLILGSLQMLCWLFFRPAAWRNHLKRIDSTLDTDIFLITFIRQGRWRNLALWRLLIQGYIILPILVNLLVGLVLWALGTPIAIIFISVPFGLLGGLAVGLVGGLAVGLAFVLAFGCGLMFGLTFGLLGGLVVGLAFGLAFGLLGGLALGLTFGLAFGLVEGLALGLTFGLAVSLIFGLAVGWMGGLMFGLTFGLAVGLGLTIHSWRPFLSFPFLTVWNYRLFRLDKIRNAKSPCLFRYHSAFWDEWQRLHLPGLDEYLLFVIEHNSVEGKAALEYLTTSHQRWAAQAAQIELDARHLESCTNMEAIRLAHRSLTSAELDNPVSTLLNIFSDISKDVDAALNRRSSYSQCQVLTTVANSLDANLQKISRSSNEYATRFYPIAQSWLNIINNHIGELVKSNELRQEIDSPYKES
ncbi:hypothetical protein NIES22_25840 [Calothrix brevissima NIES-22]|nr:hypothetical protein NIES22_25840 [Calothrix brevissima NIES-22]